MAPQFPDSAVEIIENVGEWFVRVVEDGVEQVTSFETEAFARSFGDGQRIRLGLNAGPEAA